MKVKHLESHAAYSRRNKRVGVLGLLIGLLIVTAPFPSDATTHKCTYVDRKALLGYEGKESVSLKGSDSDRECRWSIGNAAVDGMTSPQFVSALNTILSGGVPSGTSDAAPFLVDLVAGPFMDDSSRTSLANSLSFDSVNIMQCIDDFLHGGMPDTSAAGFVCTARTDYGGNVIQQSAIAVEIAVTEPTLLVAFSDGQNDYAIAIPRSILYLGQTGFRY